MTDYSPRCRHCRGKLRKKEIRGGVEYKCLRCKRKYVLTEKGLKQTV